jgi:hypothetical protein
MFCRVQTVLFFFAAVVLRSSAAELPAAWANVQTFQVEKSGLAKVDLPLETLNAARPYLEDLRLYDDTGKEIPFLVERPIRTVRQTRPAGDLRIEVAVDQTLVRFASESAQPLSGITLVTPAREFIKAVMIEASSEGQAWVNLARGQPVFRQSGGADQLFMPLPRGPWRFFRLTLDDRRSPPIPVTGIQLHEADPVPVPEIPVDIKLIEREEILGETRVTLQVPAANLTLAGLALETPDVLFTRPVALSVRQFQDQDIKEKLLYQATIFRVAIDSQTSISNVAFASDLTMPSREVLLRIDNGDSPPLKIAGFNAQRRPVYVVFLAPQVGNYHFLSGNPQCALPRYDLASQKAQLTSAVLLSKPPQNLQPNPAYKPVEAIPEISLGSAIDSSSWKCRKLVPIVRAGTYQVDLDLEVLSRTRSLHDVRLLAGDRQLPYILERTSIHRALNPEVKAVDDPKRPKVSRWELILPFPRLPVMKLSWATDSPYFRRNVQVYEEIEDNLGAPQKLFHAQTLWVKSLEQPSGLLALNLNPPQANRLILEIDNGDNPPIQLKNIQAWYPLTRLLFKAPAHATNLHLYFGNPEAPPPQYDLELVASQLLATDKTKTTLGKEEILRADSWIEGIKTKQRATALFWIVLVVVVLGLLYLIAKLLPQSDSPHKPAG